MRKNMTSSKIAIMTVLGAFVLISSTQELWAHDVGGDGSSSVSRGINQGGNRPLWQLLEQHPNLRARLREKADQNGDGVVDETEREEAFQILRERREEKRGQRQERLEEWSANHPAISDRIDRNDDGTIGRREARSARRGRRVNGFFDEHPRLENRVDRNDDGYVGRREAKQARKIRNANDNGSGNGHSRLGRRADHNQGGRVGRREVKRARQVRSSRNG
jgi:hypothetical protein